MAHRHVTYEATGDVDEAEAYCTNCDQLRLFRRQAADFSALEAAAPVPDVRRAVAGEEGWACPACGEFRRELVAERAYPVAFANATAIRQDPEEDEQGRHREGVGEDFELRSMTDAEEAIHEATTEPEAVRSSATADVDERRVPDAVLERRMAEAAAAQEEGREDLGIGPPARKPLPPPERIPPRDPTDDEA